MAKMNWLDRAIGSLAPGVAARRLRSRAMLDVMTRSYDASTPGRRTAGWRSAPTSADAEIGASAANLRDKMRELVRNNPHAAKAIAVLVNNAVGDGIVPRPKTGNDDLDKSVMSLWEEWSRVCDADGQLDIYGIQSLAAREMFEGGDAIVRRRNRRISDRLPVPMQVQVQEADLLDASKEGPSASNTIIQGVEFDQIGRRVAYWMYPAHPGNSYIAMKGASLSSVRVPSDMIIHLYEKQRTQVRGVPWGTPSMSTLRDLAVYEDAELTRKQLEACVVGVVTGGEPTDNGLGIPLEGTDRPPGVYDASGALVERFEPGMFAYAHGGKDVKFNAPSQTGTYDVYKRSILRTVAAGWRIPYELLTGDLSQVSFISGRMGLLEFRRLISSLQWQLLIPVMCQRIWDWFCESAYAAGKLPQPTIPVEWSPPEWTTIDPLNDANAALISMRAGIRSWDDVVSASGRDPDAVMQEIADRMKKFDDLGLIFDCDPRKVAKSGAVQADPSAQGAPPAEAPPPPN